MEATAATAETEIRTDDLAMATFLNLSGCKHSRLEMKDRRSAEWVFEGGDQLRNLAASYQQAKGAVEPLAYSRALRRVRDELYAFIRANAR